MVAIMLIFFMLPIEPSIAGHLQAVRIVRIFNVFHELRLMAAQVICNIVISPHGAIPHLSIYIYIYIIGKNGKKMTYMGAGGP